MRASAKLYSIRSVRGLIACQIPAVIFESILNERFNRAEPCFNRAKSVVHVGHLGKNPVEFLIYRQIRGVGVFVAHLSPD
jgi:hypothetical protein